MPEIVPGARVEAVKPVEATPGGQELSLVESQVPLAHGVGGIAGLAQLVCQSGRPEGQGHGLSGANDPMLQTWGRESEPVLQVS